MTSFITPDLPEPKATFADLGIRAEIVRALGEKGIEYPFAIQELTLPLALTGDDLIGQARTGMGKTFAFGVPLLQRITTSGPDRPLNGTPRALIVVPTRELCLQVHGDLSDAAKYLNAEDGRPLSVVSIYGGRPYEPQVEALRAGADVVVGTPGRLLDLAQQGHLQLGGLSVLVLDEADEMLDLGFLPDIERILRQIPDERQSMLFSATMPDPIITLARTFMNQPTHIRAEAPHSSAVHDSTTQFVYRAHALDKVELVSRVLQARGRGATMIFTRTKRTAQKVADELAERGFAVGAVHGDLGQIAREKALKQFRSGAIDVLVATDVAARGIDIDDITHVINYQIPEDEQAYVHRIGRTGRAGKTGIAVTLVDWDELPRWTMIDKALGLSYPEPAETYSNSPHIYVDLDIPTDTTGRIGAPKKSPVKRSPSVGDRGSSDQAPARKSTRQRRRTRGGQSATGHSVTNGETDGSAAPEGASDAPSGDGTRARRRRRRPRKAAGAEAPVATAN
ncbi:DEAD/DEAH box helicase [Mycobacterium paraterrae]|uniref:RNA helicase n=1 Tax=Mycobacterium paraterrae TaxID=577492 RepID=A0ABY3VG97_9MYCO|nr:DEAD/DEAH box helicase [Mycobacterium paraterrae]UMB68376.1 DEAD/DEAH box helicase [Mycobacterium paraterrae]